MAFFVLFHRKDRFHACPLQPLNIKGPQKAPQHRFSCSYQARAVQGAVPATLGFV